MNKVLRQVLKYILTSSILVFIIFFTFSKIFDKESLVVIEHNIKNLKISYILICSILVILYFILQGVYIKYILKALNKNIKLIKGIFYSIIEFFFSGITPSSTGGQPVQLYYMTKDKIPMRKSYITLILNTVFFKLVLLILGIFVLIFNNSYIVESKPIYQLFFWLGFILDLIIIIIGFFLLFKINVINKLYSKLYKILKKIKLFNKKIDDLKPSKVIGRYNDEIVFIKTHTKTVLITFLITFIQRIVLFSVTYVVYRALGFDKYNYFDLLAIQVSVQLAIEALPLPGGAGLSEGMLHSIFISIYASKLADVGMLLTRTFTFYIPLILSGLIIFIEYIYKRTRKD